MEGNLEHRYDHDISQVLLVLEAQDRYQIVLTAPTALPDVRQFFADTAVGAHPGVFPAIVTDRGAQGHL